MEYHVLNHGRFLLHYRRNVGVSQGSPGTADTHMKHSITAHYWTSQTRGGLHVLVRGVHFKKRPQMSLETEAWGGEGVCHAVCGKSNTLHNCRITAPLSLPKPASSKHEKERIRLPLRRWGIERGLLLQSSLSNAASQRASRVYFLHLSLALLTIIGNVFQ